MSLHFWARYSIVTTKYDATPVCRDYGKIHFVRYTFIVIFSDIKGLATITLIYKTLRDQFRLYKYYLLAQLWTLKPAFDPRRQDPPAEISGQSRNTPTQKSAGSDPVPATFYVVTEKPMFVLSESCQLLAMNGLAFVR